MKDQIFRCKTAFYIAQDSGKQTIYNDEGRPGLAQLALGLDAGHEASGRRGCQRGQGQLPVLRHQSGCKPCLKDAGCLAHVQLLGPLPYTMQQCLFASVVSGKMVDAVIPSRVNCHQDWQVSLL